MKKSWWTIPCLFLLSQSTCYIKGFIPLQLHFPLAFLFHFLVSHKYSFSFLISMNKRASIAHLFTKYANYFPITEPPLPLSAVEQSYQSLKQTCCANNHVIPPKPFLNSWVLLYVISSQPGLSIQFTSILVECNRAFSSILAIESEIWAKWGMHY